MYQKSVQLAFLIFWHEVTVAKRLKIDSNYHFVKSFFKKSFLSQKGPKKAQNEVFQEVWKYFLFEVTAA